RLRRFGDRPATPDRDDEAHWEAHQVFGQRRNSIVTILRPAKFDRHVAAFDVTHFAQASPESWEVIGCVVGSAAIKKSDHRHSRLLCARRERPRGRAAEQRDEFAPFHSITSSASASSLSGIWRPSVLAVLRLITNSNLVDR